MDASATTVSKADLIASEPDYQFVLPFNNYAVSETQIYTREFYNHFLSTIAHHTHFKVIINHFVHVDSDLGAGRPTIIGAVRNITFAFPSFPPLTQPEDITDYDDDDGETWCDADNWPNRCAGYTKCPCPHRLVVEKNKIVELMLVDDTKRSSMLTHPFHLHGHDFYVLDMAPFPTGVSLTPESVADIVQNGRFDEVFGQSRKAGRSVLNAPSKDTVQVPSSGVVRLRFNSTNAGFWLMHCHIDWHQSIGMAFVFQVGDISEMASTPESFPTCYDYAPDIDLEAN